jgi:hypothetical protein
LADYTTQAPQVQYEFSKFESYTWAMRCWTYIDSDSIKILFNTTTVVALT